MNCRRASTFLLLLSRRCTPTLKAETSLQNSISILFGGWEAFRGPSALLSLEPHCQHLRFWSASSRVKISSSISIRESLRWGSVDLNSGQVPTLENRGSVACLTGRPWTRGAAQRPPGQMRLSLPSLGQGGISPPTPQSAGRYLVAWGSHARALGSAPHPGKNPEWEATQEATEGRHPDAEKLWNVPNSLSIVRGLSGPPIALLIIYEQWPAALVAVSVSGATDWLDGHLARRMGLQSVLGSYLDPLGDKMLICR